MPPFVSARTLLILPDKLAGIAGNTALKNLAQGGQKEDTSRSTGASRFFRQSRARTSEWLGNENQPFISIAQDSIHAGRLPFFEDSELALVDEGFIFKEMLLFFPDELALLLDENLIVFDKPLILFGHLLIVINKFLIVFDKPLIARNKILALPDKLLIEQNKLLIFEDKEKIFKAELLNVLAK